MKTAPLAGVLATLGVLAATIQLSSAATTFSWNVASPGANNWNVNANWLPNTGNPGSPDTAVFGVTGTSANSTTANSVVSANTAITSLQYTNNTGTWHVTQIPDGATLTTFGNVIVGNSLVPLPPQDGATTSAAMVGGGTFAATGNLFLIGFMGASALNGRNSTVPPIWQAASCDLPSPLGGERD